MNRYCTNCGSELAEQARFCGSCGKPAHEVAAVATPEADVPVPPPPATVNTTSTGTNAGTGGAPMAEPWVGGLLRNVTIAAAAVIVLIVIFGVLAGGGEGSSAGGGSPGSADGGGDNSGADAQYAGSSGGSSEENARVFTEDDSGALYSDPDAFEGSEVDVAGQLLERPEEVEGELAFQMFVDIENADWNTIVYTDQTDLDLNTDDYVRVSGEVLGAFEGENAFGGAITSPVVQAADVSAVSAGEAIDPAREVREVGRTLGNQGFDVTVEKIEFGEESTRAYVAFANNTGAGASFYAFDANIVQGSTQIDYLEDSYAYYDEEPQEAIRPGVTTEGVIAFGPVKPDEPFELRLPWTSDDYDVTSRPVVFRVAP